jgi:glycosyltransferase involved in cell wall biosynthesis
VQFSGDDISIVIPAKNEGATIAQLVKAGVEIYPTAEILVIDDASTDDTAALAQASGAVVISQKYSLGNGAAIKSGARAASRPLIIFMDGDGQHAPTDIARLVQKINDGYDMAVGARNRSSQASHQRAFANGFYNWFASKMVNHKVDDLTSGFRAVKRKLFLRYIDLLPNGFSYPTTITMAFFRAGYAVAYVPIQASRRQGTSHIRPLRDGIRFLMIIFKIGSLYSPLKIFLPISVSIFSVGAGYYLYTYSLYDRFTNMSALLFTSSILIFLMGLISEQITSLMYISIGKDDR